MRVATFTHLGSSYLCVWQESMMRKDGALPGYVRISEWVDVDFPPRAQAEVVPEELAQIEEKAQELKSDFAKKMGALEERRAQLLAITDERAIL